MPLNKVNIGRYYHWHPWIGCHKISPACQNCFVKLQNDFKWLGNPVPSIATFGNIIITCLSSDFFLEEADSYRNEIWQTIKNNPEYIFLIITKRVERIKEQLPPDWNDGYDNVIIEVTVETQELVNYRLNIFRDIPCKHKWLSCCPLIEPLDLTSFLKEGWIECIEACGETGEMDKVRPTYYEWVESLSEQCKKYQVRFMLMKIGYNFIHKGERHSERSACYFSSYADALGLDVAIPISFKLNNKDYIIK